MKKIALGTWSWGNGTAGGNEVFGNNLSIDDLKLVFDSAMRSGLNFWDTAAVYGMGASENILGQLQREYSRKDIILSTKFTPQIANDSENPIEEMLDSSLERLGTDYIDIYWIHNPSDAPKWIHGLIPLLKKGKIKSVGVSNHNLSQIKEANEILEKSGYKLSAVQNHYSLLYRSSEEAGILNYCIANNISFFAYMVLEQGALTGKYDIKHPLPEGSARGNTYNKQLPQLDELINTMRTIGDTKKASVSQIALAWAMAKNAIPIVGVTKPLHIEEALGATNIHLSEDEIVKIEELASKTGTDTKGAWENPMI